MLNRIIQIAVCLCVVASTVVAQSGNDSEQGASTSIADVAAQSRKVREAQLEKKAEESDPVKAERRRRFEAAKQLIENNPTPLPSTEGRQGHATGTAPTIILSPIQAAMLIGEQRGFSLLTNDNHHLEQDAEWVSSDPSVVEVVGVATIAAKAEGTAVIKAHIHGQDLQASITVYPGNSLPKGTPRWTAPTGGSGRPQIVPAIPH